MNSVRPGILAVRTVNSYRRREVVTYLALRYYLHNAATRSDQWVKRVATKLTLCQDKLPYCNVLQFKDVSPDNTIKHRSMFLPGANEALAEAALLSECANYPEAFASHNNVFSYQLTENAERTGVFKHYITGLRNRHQAIGEICDAYPNGIVYYTDIKSFYPSINLNSIRKTWQSQCDKSSILPHFRDLGEKLIDNYSRMQNAHGVLIGPMFSHFLANLVLREIDDQCTCNINAEYFRYVDDIVLVGNKKSVANSFQYLQGCLNDIGLQLHDDSSYKNLKVPVAKWLEGRNDFVEYSGPKSWPALIGNLKRYLLMDNNKRFLLQELFHDEDFRIPIPDYSEASYEASFLTRVTELSRFRWFRKNIQKINAITLLDQAKHLRKEYREEFMRLFEKTIQLKGYDRKRFIPKLRYRASRLIYLASEETLVEISQISKEMPELYFYSKVIDSICDGNIDDVLSMGTNAAQATAQTLKAKQGKAYITKQHLNKVEMQSLAIFYLNGIVIDNNQIKKDDKSELIKFARDGVDLSLMKSSDAFIEEISCLHGSGPEQRHKHVLDTAFDIDEEIIFDAIDSIQYPLAS